MKETTSSGFASNIMPASEKPRGLLAWWYNLAAVPEPAEGASFVQREMARKTRSLSIAVLTIWVIFFLFIPGCLVLPNHYVIYADLGMMPICFIALIINKKQHPVLAGALVTFAFELALAAVCLTTWPFDEPSIQQYELFVLGEIMALTLVSPRGMILVGLANVIFITLDLIFQPHTLVLDQDLRTQFAAMLIRPVSIQIMVAVVISWYANNQLKTIQRADRAQMIASLEHQMAEQQRQRSEEMQYLADYVQSIARQYSEIVNQRRIKKISDEGCPEPFRALLLPIVNGFNMLLTRLQRAGQTEQELRALEKALQDCTNLVYQGRFSLEEPLRTGTPLDPFLASLRDQHRATAKNITEAPTSPMSPLQPEPGATFRNGI